MGLEVSPQILFISGGLYRRVWVYTPNGRKYFPSGSVRNEREPSTPLKELLDEEAFI